MTGFETAFGEITLVLFTTLAPSGAIAIALMGLPVLMGRASVAEQRRIDLFLCIPLVVAMVGLIASATHLGNPANALYVFMGVGRSPLSTEVFCAVVFLGLVGVYWLYSFAEQPHHMLQRVWMALIVLAGAAFVTAVALAYAADTIMSWDTPWVPLNLWLNALVGGPMLALLGLRAAKYEPANAMLGRVLVAVSVVALVLNVIGYCLQGTELPLLQNSFTSAADLVPGYGAMTVVFAVCAALGIAVGARTSSRRCAIVACVLVLAGIFIMRFAFYMMHLTIGLGV